MKLKVHVLYLVKNRKQIADSLVMFNDSRIKVTMPYWCAFVFDDNVKAVVKVFYNS